MKKVSLLNRERLNNLLSVIYNYPLTILEAPIGFGKTTAVRSFLHSEKVHSLWISFLNSTESAAFFWEKFTGELGKLNEKEAARLKALGFPANVPQFEKVIEILGEIQFKRKTVLVIDDFHLCSDDSISTFLLGLIAEKIENLSVVIITRNTANLNYAESLSRGLCHLISQQHLKFTNEEIRDYCLLTDDKISNEELTKICEYTDGWISLVYLVLIGLENGIPVGMNDSIDELIEKTMFHSYDDRIKDFLFMLSIMNIFTAQ